MIDRATAERIKDTARIEEVIGDFISLRKRGTNYWGLCPFHQDRNPSLSVSPSKGIFKCFVCGKAGSAISFLMEQEHLSYSDALRYLAKKYGIEIVEKEETAEEMANRKKHESLLVVTDYAQKFYQKVLWETEVGKAIGLSYFREREFTEETIREFGLGYAPSKSISLTSDALKAGYKKEYLIETGLAVEKEDGRAVDRFFDRVMFPIYSISGRVIGFGGRTLKTDKSVAKYVNSPQSEIYDKSNTLYGLYQAKSAITKQDRCILVEGYADVISMHQAGIKNVVASSGTSLTKGQIRLIKRFTENVTIIYDGDTAGIHAALRGIDLILEEGLAVKVALLPPEDDPDTFAKSHTFEEIQEFIDKGARDFIEFKSDVLLEDTGNDPILKSRMLGDMVQSVAVIPDPIVRETYAKTVSERFEYRLEPILQKIRQIRAKKRELERSARNFEERQNNLRQPNETPGDGLRTDVPMPEEEYDYYGAEEAPQTSESPVCDLYLSVPEREIAYYLVKFGSYPLSTNTSETVASYIRSALEEDELTLVNPIYRRIYDCYYAFEEELQETGYIERQKRTVRYFTTMEDQSVAEEALSMICEDHPITVKEYVEAIPPEESSLSRTVPKAIGVYKIRIVDEQIKALAKKISEVQHDASGVQEQIPPLVRMLQNLTKVKNKMSKEINRL